MMLKSMRLATAAPESLAGSQELSILDALPAAASAGLRLEGRATGVLLPSQDWMKLEVGHEISWTPAPPRHPKLQPHMKARSEERSKEWQTCRTH